jgi:hypothetical protein
MRKQENKVKGLTKTGSPFCFSKCSSKEGNQYVEYCALQIYKELVDYVEGTLKYRIRVLQ